MDLPVGQGLEYPLNALVEIDGTVSGDWSYGFDPTDGVDTYYAPFENVFVFDCSGGGLEGQYVLLLDRFGQDEH